MPDMQCGLAQDLKVYIMCVDAALNPLGLSIFVYTDGRLLSAGKAQIYYLFIAFKYDSRLSYKQGEFSHTPFDREHSSLIKHLSQCGPTALLCHVKP